MSFSFSTTDGQSRYVRFDLLGENKQRSAFPPREFPNLPQISKTTQHQQRKLHGVEISNNLPRSDLTHFITHKSQLMEMWRKASYRRKYTKVLRQKIWLKESIGEENEKSSASEIWIMTSLHSSWLNLSAPDFYHSISWRTQSVPPSSLPPKSQSAEMWKKSLNHVKLSPCWFADLITLILSCIWQ